MCKCNNFTIIIFNVLLKCIRNISYIWEIMYISAVKRLIVINHIQNKLFCLHNISVYSVYLLCIFKYKYMHVYI